MERETQVQLIDRILQLEADNTTDMVERSGSVAVDQYLDTQQFANEEQTLFRRLPLVLGHASQLPESGDFLTRDVCGVPVILLRDNQGVLRAFINVCKHRGGRLVREAEGKNLRVLVCQYHAWSYNTDGGLRAIPHRDGFSDLPDNCKSLSELPLLERYGLLWVRLTPYAADESQEDFVQQWQEFMSPEIDRDLAAYGFDSHVVFDPVEFHRPINWKLAVDTFLENYHVRKTHKKTIDFMFLDNVGLYEKKGLHQRNLYPKKTIVQLREQPQSEWQLSHHGNMLYTLFPNTLLLVEPDHVNVSIVFPEGVGQTHLINFTLLPEKPSEKGMAYFRKNNAILYEALEEDFSMATDVQNSLRSGALEEFQHGRFEQGLSYFHQTVAELTSP